MIFNLDEYVLTRMWEGLSVPTPNANATLMSAGDAYPRLSS